jgi:diadenosine tetraphosphate (Ap4A) HIT family hydrolase
MKTPGAHCDFCNELSKSPDTSYTRIYGRNQKSRILFQSANLVVVPSLGQLVEGYLLVLPIAHFRALGDLPPALLEEFSELAEHTRNIVQNHYGKCIVFEHGTRSEGAGGCGIYHAHLHAVPLASAHDPINMLKVSFAFEEFKSLKELEKRSADLPTYFFYQDSEARLYLFDTGPLPSQYLRKVLADSLGQSDWDWRTAGKEARLLATMEKLSGKFETISTLSSRL